MASLAKNKIATVARAAEICEKFSQFCEKIGDESRTNLISKVYFKNAKIVATVKNASFAHQIFLRKSEFLSTENAVREIITKVE